VVGFHRKCLKWLYVGYVKITSNNRMLSTELIVTLPVISTKLKQFQEFSGMTKYDICQSNR